MSLQSLLDQVELEASAVLSNEAIAIESEEALAEFESFEATLQVKLGELSSSVEYFTEVSDALDALEANDCSFEAYINYSAKVQALSENFKIDLVSLEEISKTGDSANQTQDDEKDSKEITGVEPKAEEKDKVENDKKEKDEKDKKEEKPSVTQKIRQNMEKFWKWILTKFKEFQAWLGERSKKFVAMKDSMFKRSEEIDTKLKGM